MRQRIGSSLEKGGGGFVLSQIDEPMASQKRSDSIDAYLDTEPLAGKRDDVTVSASGVLEDELGNGTGMDRLERRSPMASPVAMGSLDDLVHRHALRHLDGPCSPTYDPRDTGDRQLNATVREEVGDETNEQPVMFREVEEVQRRPDQRALLEREGLCLKLLGSHPFGERLAVHDQPSCGSVLAGSDELA
jgi:hypothetical protein